MSIRVRVPYKILQSVPPVCVCCGSSNACRDFYVSQSHIISSLSTKFPLCDRCYDLIGRRKGSCLIVLVSILASIGILFLFQADDRFPKNIITSISSGILLYFLLRLFIVQRSRKGLSQDEIVLQNKALTAVKIIWYTPFSITLKFENEEFAKWFAAMNGGKVLRD